MSRRSGTSPRRRNDVGEIQIKTLEGLSTGMRNFLRLFREVGNKYLYQYMELFEWGYNVEPAMPKFLRAILVVRSVTT
jgi:hypothetical protein